MGLYRYDRPTLKHNDEIANYTTFSSDLRIRVRSKLNQYQILTLRSLSADSIDDLHSVGLVESIWGLKYVPGDLIAPRTERDSGPRSEPWAWIPRIGELAPVTSWSVTPPRILLKSNFWPCRSSEKSNTRCVVHFLERSTSLTPPMQSHSRKFDHFFRARFHEFHFTTVANNQKSTLRT